MRRLRDARGGGRRDRPVGPHYARAEPEVQRHPGRLPAHQAFTSAAPGAYTSIEEVEEASGSAPSSTSHLARRGAVVARQAHNLEVTGSNPVAATRRAGKLFPALLACA